MIERTYIQVRRADYVGFTVASFDEALRSWVRALGARLVRKGEVDGDFIGKVMGAHGAQLRAAVESSADLTVEHLEFHGLERPRAPTRPFDSGFAHLAFVVDYVDATGSPLTAGRNGAHRSLSREAHERARGCLRGRS